MTLLNSILSDINDQYLIDYEIRQFKDREDPYKSMRRQIDGLLSMKEDMCDILDVIQEEYLFFDRRLTEEDENYAEDIKYIPSRRTKKIIKKIQKTIKKLSGASYIQFRGDSEYIIPKQCE